MPPPPQPPRSRTHPVLSYPSKPRSYGIVQILPPKYLSELSSSLQPQNLSLTSYYVSSQRQPSPPTTLPPQARPHHPFSPHSPHTQWSLPHRPDLPPCHSPADSPPKFPVTPGMEARFISPPHKPLCELPHLVILPSSHAMFSNSTSASTRLLGKPLRSFFPCPPPTWVSTSNPNSLWERSLSFQT